MSNIKIPNKMKKYLFFYAVAACVAISSVSCGSDDEDYLPPKTPVTLTEPEYASQAATFEISGNAVQASSGKAYLSSLSFTESGKAIIEVASGAESVIRRGIVPALHGIGLIVDQDLLDP